MRKEREIKRRIFRRLGEVSKRESEGDRESGGGWRERNFGARKGGG